MPLSVGDKLGPYEILAPIGAGGMGEVYRARDTRLGRDVAIKISKEQFSERFEREARAVAALNHPNICQLYDVGPNYLVMELIEGETLKGPLPLDAALDYARQVAEALEAAHEKGIIHRDLKPANIKITPHGVVKVLDFGLASVAPAAPASDASKSPTLTISPTIAGMILGTAAYMPPEQARGKAVDKRADIWAFGCVFYEMITGRQLFQGSDVSEILASVIKEQPDLTGVPANIQRLLRRCLEKDPKKRLRDIGDAMPLLHDGPETAAPQPARARRNWLWPALAAALLLTLGAISLLHLREKPAPPPAQLRFQIQPPDKNAFGDNVALSPDGRLLAFTATTSEGRTQIWLRNLDGVESRPLQGTEGATNLFWSPDSRFLAFALVSRLKKIDISGGPPLTLCDVPQPIGSGSWSVQNVILFGGRLRGALWRVSAAGGEPSPVTALDPRRQDQFHSFASFLPDARHFFYLRRSNIPENSGIFLGSLDAKPEEQSTKPLLASPFSEVYAPSSDPRSGHLLFLREGTLMAQSFDAQDLKLTGEPVPAAEQVASINGVAGQFTASTNGVLAYHSGVGVTDIQLTWFDRAGKALTTVGDTAFLQRPTISPDGRTVAIDRRDSSGFFDVWLYDLARGNTTRLTFGSHDSGFPVWSPDGTRLAYYAALGGHDQVVQKAASGVGQEEVLDPGVPGRRPLDWSRDGRYIIEGISDPKTKLDVWVLPLFGDLKPFPYLHSEFNELDAKLSPDGEWIAYTCDETGRSEIYVQTFPKPEGKWQVSTSGGRLPVWSRDGKELFFISAAQKMMAVEVKSGSKPGARFEAGVPKPLFDTHLEVPFSPSFDVSKDGRFLLPTRTGQGSTSPITVIVNWTTGLK
jgi:serine/threonine protein kinase